MTFYSLLFYFLAGLGVLIFASVTNSLIGGRLRSAWRTLCVYLVVAAVYAAVLVTTTLAVPIQVLTANEAQYSGDWSVAVASLRRVPRGLDEFYEIDFRLTNRGTNAIRGEKNLIVYLLGEDGTRYNPNPEPSTPAFDAEIKPSKYITTTRVFVLPPNLNRVELVIARQGFSMGWFILGRHPFDGHTVVLLQ